MLNLIQSISFKHPLVYQQALYLGNLPLFAPSAPISILRLTAILLRLGATSSLYCLKRFVLVYFDDGNPPLPRRLNIDSSNYILHVSSRWTKKAVLIMNLPRRVGHCTSAIIGSAYFVPTRYLNQLLSTAVILYE